MATLTLVDAGDVITATPINNLVNILQQPSGGQDTGHYLLEHNSYASGAFFSSYCFFRSRTSVAVSVSLGTGDAATTNCNTPSVGHITQGGCQIFTSSTAIATNAHCGGTTTIQY